MKSQKEIVLERKILKMLSGHALHAAERIFRDKELQYLQEYANIVAIKRLHLNDHGPVHMRKVALNALIMTDLLKKAEIKLSFEKEDTGTFEDSVITILLAAFLHDVGMTVGREKHEHTGVIVASPVLDRILTDIYRDNLEKKVVIRSMIIEAIVGHMATYRICSPEASLILIADGLDVEKGRARIPMKIHTESVVGDIHKYSASSIERVTIEKGEKRPIKIIVEMTASVGFFQVEEVLIRKINSSTIKPLIELYAGVMGQEMKHYL